MDETVDLPIDDSIASELEEDLDFGTDDFEESSEFAARVHKTPIGLRLNDVQIRAEAEVDRNLSLFYEAYDLWLVPHRVSFMRRRGRAELTSVGIEVEYLPGVRTCCIVSLLPSFEFTVHGQASVGGSFRGIFSTSGVAEPTDSAIMDEASLPAPGQMRFGVTSDMRLGFQFRATVATPKIAAVGVGSTECEWRIDRDVQPLFGHDIETWAVVALPSVSVLNDRIDYKIRFYHNYRTFVFNTRRQSRWEAVSCQLPKALTTTERDIWDLLSGGARTVDQILASFPALKKAGATATLGIMEKRRLVRRQPGDLFAQA